MLLFGLFAYLRRASRCGYSVATNSCSVLFSVSRKARPVSLLTRIWPRRAHSRKTCERFFLRSLSLILFLMFLECLRPCFRFSGADICFGPYFVWITICFQNWRFVLHYWTWVCVQAFSSSPFVTSQVSTIYQAVVKSAGLLRAFARIIESSGPLLPFLCGLAQYAFIDTCSFVLLCVRLPVTLYDWIYLFISFAILVYVCDYVMSLCYI